MFGKFLNFVRRYPSRVAYCVPYWDSETYLTIIRKIIFGGVVNGDNIHRLENALKDFFSISNVHACGSGRLAIELALKSAGIVSGDEVIIPSFSCDGVIEPVIQSGAIPVFVEVGDELNITARSVESGLSQRTRAVIVPHMFGNPADIEAIEMVCSGREITIIDDAAQAYGATINGKRVGTFGQIGVVSFGNGKICFGTGGGVILTDNIDYHNNIKKVSLNERQRKERVSRALYVLFMRRWRRWFFPLERIGFLGKIKHISLSPYDRVRMGNIDASIALVLLKTLDKNIESRRLKVRAYRDLLGGVDWLRLVEHQEGSVCLTQPLIIIGSNASQITRKIRNALNDSGYEINTSYTPLHHKAQYNKYCKGILLHTDQVWDKILELPCEPLVSMKDIEKISRIIKSFTL
ncbi:DegT/DnrJ/EryC1/StrS family aminotransferase [Beggiatoa alba]|nr:DegT/DnrJ/EryC1/StrS family aminotransferase [Beggiatoa alba]